MFTTYKEYLKKVKEELFSPKTDPHKDLQDIIAIISNLEPKEVADCKDLLLELQKLLERVLSGGD